MKWVKYIIVAFFGLQLSRPFLEKGLESLTAPYIVFLFLSLIIFYVVFVLFKAHENKKIRKLK